MLARWNSSNLILDQMTRTCEIFTSLELRPAHFRIYLPGQLQEQLGRVVPVSFVKTEKHTQRSKCVRFSPTGRSFAAATVEGLLIYSLDNTLLFDPFLLGIDITPSSVRETLAEARYLLALLVHSSVFLCSLV